MGGEIWTFNKLDGQNFCASYNPKKKEFIAFGSKKMIVDETHEQFGAAVLFFKENYELTLKDIIKNNNGKGDIFNSINEITFYFEIYGENSFAGRHKDTDELKLALIDIFLKKKGYVEPKIFYKIFSDKNIELPEVIYKGKLTQDFIQSINLNNWAEKDCTYPQVKEDVVCKCSTLLKGQKLPMVKIKTNWWLNELKTLYPNNWEELE